MTTAVNASVTPRQKAKGYTIDRTLKTLSLLRRSRGRESQFQHERSRSPTNVMTRPLVITRGGSQQDQLFRRCLKDEEVDDADLERGAIRKREGMMRRPSPAASQVLAMPLKTTPGSALDPRQRV